MKYLMLLYFFCFANIFLSAQNISEDLLVFVGKKIAITKQGSPSVSVDTFITKKDTVFILKIKFQKYKATYKIEKIYCGDYSSDTISFFTYSDEPIIPILSKYENIMLFLYKENDVYYHKKKLFFDVYQTKKGEWASDYSYEDYNRPDSKTFTVKPEKIKFKNKLSYVISNYKEEYIKKHFPSPYYIIKKNKAIAVYGNYAPELVNLKMQGILK
ncbi:MAG: hypothetical protein PHS30_00875 [Bacteroidales bacterium]|nr:hypothetical protein [Bacteroidales bacterium]